MCVCCSAMDHMNVSGQLKEQVAGIPGKEAKLVALIIFMCVLKLV